MRLLQERDSSDSELLAYAVTLINKTLHGLPDQDSYYDQIEYLEGLGMQQIVSRYVLSVIALCEFETSGFIFLFFLFCFCFFFLLLFKGLSRNPMQTRI